MPANPGKVVTIYKVSQLLSIAWSKAMVPRNIASGFRATGVFPVNRYAISLPGERPRPSGTPIAVLTEKQGINFMPFYSPTSRKADFSNTILRRVMIRLMIAEAQIVREANVSTRLHQHGFAAVTAAVDALCVCWC